MIFVQTDINSTTVTPEAIMLKSNIEEYLKLTTVRQNHVINLFFDSISMIEDEKSRLIIESWFKNTLNN